MHIVVSEGGCGWVKVKMRMKIQYVSLQLILLLDFHHYIYSCLPYPYPPYFSPAQFLWILSVLHVHLPLSQLARDVCKNLLSQNLTMSVSVQCFFQQHHLKSRRHGKRKKNFFYVVATHSERYIYLEYVRDRQNRVL